jgi:hypothetical protein
MASSVLGGSSGLPVEDMMEVRDSTRSGSFSAMA